MINGDHLDSDEQTLYTIDQVATRTGFTKRTLRYYEELGLLAPAGRTEGNYRRYGESDIERLDYIKKLRDLLGFSLTDIGKLLEVRDERNQIKMAYKHETDTAAKIAQLDRGDELIHTQLQLIEQKLAGLEQMHAALIEQLERHERKRKELLDT